MKGRPRLLLVGSLAVALAVAGCGVSEESREGAPSTGTAGTTSPAQMGDEQDLASLVEALADPDPEVRAGAAAALGALGDSAAVVPLAGALEDGDPTVVETAAAALGTLADPAAVEPLVRYSTQNAEGAKAALVAIGEPAVEPLVEALQLKSDVRRRVAAEALGEIGDARAVEPLLSYGARGYGAYASAWPALAAIGKPAVKPLIGGLDAALGEDRELVARTAIAALGEIGDPRATRVLERALGAELHAVWQEASDALAQLHRKDVGTLLAMLESAETVRVYHGLIGLGRAATEDELVAALGAFGSEEMGEEYLNCGNPTLEQAARDWASAHGYEVISLPGVGAGEWGSRG